MTYLAATYFLDFEDEAIQHIVQEFQDKSLSEKEKAIGLYLKIRDGWRYNPNYVSFQKAHFRASYIAQKSRGHCVDKAILLAACWRAVGLPARLQFAKVKNHIATERLEDVFGTNELSPHGMAQVFLDDKWLKTSPAFNKELCALYQVDVLDFDGENDSIFQQYDRAGNQFMEYLEDYGYFEDVPFAFIQQNYREMYPMIVERFKNVDGEVKII